MSSPPRSDDPAPPRIAARPPRALRLALLGLAALAGLATGLSDAPGWVALAIPLFAWHAWPRSMSTIPWSADVARRGALVVVSRRYVFLANARERRELALWRARHV